MLSPAFLTTALLFTTSLAATTGQTVIGDRKVGIVIDESNSMQTTDPNNTRIDAAIALDDALISNDEKADGKVPDVVTVIGFHSDPELLFPLGDPKSAIPSIQNISSSKPGTFIGGGIGTAINETTKPGTGETANRTGIVVLTDGEDNYSGLTGVQGTINEIVRAGQLGIRVSFGFLSVGAGSQDIRILTQCLKTGGTFASFSDPLSQKNFIEQVLRRGITGKDSTGTVSASLLPGLNTSALLSPNGNPFTYLGRAGEVLNFTITTLNRTVPLKAELRDIVKNTPLATPAGTNRVGVTSIGTTLSADTNVELKVSANGTYGETVFTVGVGSSLGLEGGKSNSVKSSAETKQASLITVFLGTMAVLGVGMFL